MESLTQKMESITKELKAKDILLAKAGGETEKLTEQLLFHLSDRPPVFFHDFPIEDENGLEDEDVYMGDNEGGRNGIRKDMDSDNENDNENDRDSLRDNESDRDNERDRDNESNRDNGSDRDNESGSMRKKKGKARQEEDDSKLDQDEESDEFEDRYMNDQYFEAEAVRPLYHI